MGEHWVIIKIDDVTDAHYEPLADNGDFGPWQWPSGQVAQCHVSAAAE